MDYKQYYRYYSRIEPVIKQPEVKAYTMLSLTLLAIAVFGFLAVRPGIENIAKTYREIQDNKVLYDTLNEKIKTLQLGKENYTRFVAPREQTVLYPALPTRPEFNSLLDKIEKTAVKANVSILSLGFQPIDLLDTDSAPTTPTATSSAQTSIAKRATKGYIAIEFSMTAVGNYDALNNFLNLLYKLDRIIVVDSVQIVSSEKSDVIKTDGSYNLTFKAQAYYQK